MFVDYAMYGVLVLLVLSVVVVVGLALRNDKLSKLAVQRLDTDAHLVESVELIDEDSVRLVLKYRGEKSMHLGCVRGVGAVRLYDRLAAIAPQAYRRITRGGRDVVL